MPIPSASGRPTPAAQLAIAQSQGGVRFSGRRIESGPRGHGAARAFCAPALARCCGPAASVQSRPGGLASMVPWPRRGACQCSGARILRSQPQAGRFAAVHRNVRPMGLIIRMWPANAIVTPKVARPQAVSASPEPGPRRSLQPAGRGRDPVRGPLSRATPSRAPCRYAQTKAYPRQARARSWMRGTPADFAARLDRSRRPRAPRRRDQLLARTCRG